MESYDDESFSRNKYENYELIYDEIDKIFDNKIDNFLNLIQLLKNFFKRNCQISFWKIDENDAPFFKDSRKIIIGNKILDILNRKSYINSETIHVLIYFYIYYLGIFNIEILTYIKNNFPNFFINGYVDEEFVIMYVYKTIIQYLLFTKTPNDIILFFLKSFLNNNFNIFSKNLSFYDGDGAGPRYEIPNANDTKDRDFLIIEFLLRNINLLSEADLIESLENMNKYISIIESAKRDINEDYYNIINLAEKLNLDTSAECIKNIDFSKFNDIINSINTFNSKIFYNHNSIYLECLDRICSIYELEFLLNNLDYILTLPWSIMNYLIKLEKIKSNLLNERNGKKEEYRSSIEICFYSEEFSWWSVRYDEYGFKIESYRDYESRIPENLAKYYSIFEKVKIHNESSYAAYIDNLNKKIDLIDLIIEKLTRK